jgi:hypothetical protein
MTVSDKAGVIGKRDRTIQSHTALRSNFIEESQAMRYIVSSYPKSSRGQRRGWHSAQARVRHTSTSAYVWLDYAMIRRLSR